jgi:hypothetical protein
MPLLDPRQYQALRYRGAPSLAGGSWADFTTSTRGLHELCIIAALKPNTGTLYYHVTFDVDAHANVSKCYEGGNFPPKRRAKGMQLAGTRSSFAVI